MKDGKRQVFLEAIFKHLFEIFADASYPSSYLFSFEIADNKKRESGKHISINWFLRVGATGFEPAT